MQAEHLRHLYREMLRIRLIEEAIADRYPEQEMRCPVHLSIGQEAVAVGVSAALGREDLVLSGHRSHAHYLACGGNLEAMLAEIYGKATGCCAGKGGSMHLVDLEARFLGAVPIVGSTIPIAVGAAFGSVMRGQQRVLVVYFGEGAVEEGVFHESVNFARLRHLPVLFVCENNLYSVYSPLSVRQPLDRPVNAIAAGHGMETAQGDGNDVVAVLEVAEAALGRIRSGRGPQFIELATYRWREHCGPYYDNDLGYRTPAEFESWKVRCPLARAKAQLETLGALGDADLTTMVETIQAEIGQAFQFAKESPFPEPDQLMRHIYA